MDAYLKAVLYALQKLPYRYDTVYFGGGTPVLLGAKRLCRILDAVDICSGAEISLEANPCAVDASLLRGLRVAGLNRISFGVQSFSDRELSALGRLHDAQQARYCVQEALRCGIGNVSIDLMLGTPCQTLESLSESIRTAVSLGVPHLSAYMLKIEPGTPYWRDQVQNSCPDDDSVAELYRSSVALLEEAGLKQYEISNFARQGYACRHNLKYWNCEDYAAVGPAAHSFLDGHRCACPAELDTFLSDPLHCDLVEEGTVSDRERAWEYAVLRLRLSEGLPLSAYAARGGDASRLLEHAEPLIAGGFVQYTGGNLRLTVDGFLLSNEVTVRLLD